MPQAQNLPLTHASVSPTGWVKLAKQIEDYDQTHRPNGYSDLRVALDIAMNMARVARKQGVRSYTEDEVLKASKDELVGPFHEGNAPGRSRDKLFRELSMLPFIDVHQVESARAVRVIIEGERAEA